MTDTPATGPVVSPTPDSKPPSPDQIGAIMEFLKNLLTSGNLRQTFDPTTYQFWVVIGSVAAIVMAWINVSNAINATVQSVITGLGGLIIAVVAAQAHKPTPASIFRMISKIHSLPQDHPVRKAFTPVVLNPSPAGVVTGPGYYPEGTHTGTVLAPGAVVVVAPPAGGASGSGSVTEGFTTEGNVSPHVTVNVQTGPYAPGTGAESNLTLGGNIGTNSAEGTGGPVISNQQGGLGTGGSVEAPGAYMQPPSPQANPDEANPTSFVAKAPVPKHRVSKKENDGEEK